MLRCTHNIQHKYNAIQDNQQFYSLSLISWNEKLNNLFLPDQRQQAPWTLGFFPSCIVLRTPSFPPFVCPLPGCVLCCPLVAMFLTFDHGLGDWFWIGGETESLCVVCRVLCWDHRSTPHTVNQNQILKILMCVHHLRNADINFKELNLNDIMSWCVSNDLFYLNRCPVDTESWWRHANCWGFFSLNAVDLIPCADWCHSSLI